ncbi:MAG: hypothetical protein U5K56_09640 [Halioglobus sp.]|nr:hypothetical protein [Halioglobus sp.]
MGLVQQHGAAPPVSGRRGVIAGVQAVHVMQVGDYDVHPGQQVPRQFVGADLVPPRQDFEIRPGQRRFADGIVQRGPEFVVVAAGVGAVVAVAGAPRRQADALLRAEAQRAAPESRRAELAQRILRRAAADGSGRDKYHPVVLAGGEGFQRREQHRGGLADAGGRFHQQLPALIDAFIGELGDPTLAGAELAVGEAQARHAVVAPCAQRREAPQPGAHTPDAVVEQRRQFRGGQGLLFAVGFVGVDIEPGQAHRQFPHPPGGGDDGGVESPLRPVQCRHGFGDGVRRYPAGFYFLHHTLFGVVAIRAAAQGQVQMRVLVTVFDGVFGPVGGCLGGVPAPVPGGALCARGRRAEPVVDVAAAVTEARQFGDGDAQLRFHASAPRPPRPVFPAGRKIAASVSGCPAGRRRAP